MSQLPSKNKDHHFSNPDLASGSDLNITQRKRKQPDDDLTHAFSNLTKELKNTLDGWKADFDQKFEVITSLKTATDKLT